MYREYPNGIGKAAGRRHKERYKRMIRKIVFILALLVFLGSGGYIAFHFYQAYDEDSAFDELKTKNGHDLVALHKQNKDLVGWIKVDGTNIDYPVVQTPDDPEYYLRRNFKKQDSVAGTPFMDSYSKIGKSKNYLIYGHNIKAGTMFHELLEFEEKDFWKKHKYFQYDELRNGKQVRGIYKIVAFFRSEISSGSSGEFRYYTYPDIEDKKTYDEYVRGIKSIAAFDTGVKAEWPNQLVTLSTCAYHTDDGRFAVVGVRVDRQ